MLANAAGPIAQLYLLVMGLPNMHLLGHLPAFDRKCVQDPLHDIRIITWESIAVSGGFLFLPCPGCPGPHDCKTDQSEDF